MVRQGTEWAVKRMGTRVPVTAQASAQAGHMRSAKAWARSGSSAQPAMKSTVKAVADGGHEGAAVEAGGGAGVLRGEAEDAWRG